MSEPVEVLAGVVEEFADGKRKIIDVRGRDVAVFRIRDRFYAFRNRCVHSGGPVGEGMLINKVEAVLSEDGQQVLGDTFSADCIHLVCPWHGWEFNIDTGAAAGDPRFMIQKFETRVDEGRVYVVS